MKEISLPPELQNRIKQLEIDISAFRNAKTKILVVGTDSRIVNRSAKERFNEALKISCVIFGRSMDEYDKHSHRHFRWVSEIRQTAWYIIFNVENFSLSKIGKLSGRTHGTVISGLQRCEDWAFMDKKYRQILQDAKTAYIKLWTIEKTVTA